MNANETLRLFRAAIEEAHQAAEGDSNDAEISALQSALDYAERLDDWMCRGGALPSEWGHQR